MAKSLRSKFKRKIRAIARTKKAPKEHKRLEAVVARREAFDAEQEENTKEELPSASQNDQEQMDTSKKPTINLKTMKLADGNYPTWMNQRQIKKLKKKDTATKKIKAKKTRGRR